MDFFIYFLFCVFFFFFKGGMFNYVYMKSFQLRSESRLPGRKTELFHIHTHKAKTWSYVRVNNFSAVLRRVLPSASGAAGTAQLFDLRGWVGESNAMHPRLWRTLECEMFTVCQLLFFYSSSWGCGGEGLDRVRTAGDIHWRQDSRVDSR